MVKIKSSEELQKERKAMVNRSTPIGCAIILIMAIAITFAAVLPFNIPVSKVPMPINFFWNTYALIVLFGLIGFALLKIALVLTKTTRHAPVEQAIGCYDSASREFAKWQKKGTKEALMQAHELLIPAEHILGELDEYVRFKAVVDAEFITVFEGHS